MAGSFRNTDEYVIRYRPKVMDTRRNITDDPNGHSWGRKCHNKNVRVKKYKNKIKC